MVKKLLALGVCTGLLSGCFQANTSQVPLATTYPTSEQQKMQAAHHWDVLAEYEARLIARTLQSKVLALNVNGGDADSEFYQGYTNLLTSQLVKKGLIVVDKPNGAAKVSFDVNVVEHTDRDNRRDVPGSWTLLATGVAVAAHVADHWSTPAKVLFPVAVAADIYSGNWVKDSEFEVIITTQVTDHSQIIHSSSNIYYINGGDASHYMPTPKEHVKRIRVTDQE